MHPFGYSVSLRVRHPSMDPRQISKALDLKPESSQKAGEPKRTPAGRLLTGVYAHSYWCSVIPHPKRLQLSPFLESLLVRLAPQRHFLARISQGGGSAELFVGWYSGSNSGEELSWKLLKRLGELYLSLSLDVYASRSCRSRRRVVAPLPESRPAANKDRKSKAQ